MGGGESQQQPKGPKLPDDGSSIIVNDHSGLWEVSKWVIGDVGDNMIDFESNFNLSVIYKHLNIIGGLKENDERGFPRPQLAWGLSATDTEETVMIKRLSPFAMNLRHSWAIIREIRFYRMVMKDQYEDLFLPLIDIITPIVPVELNSQIRDLYLVYRTRSATITLEQAFSLSEEDCKVILVQLLLAVLYLESTGIQHRDLTPNNIFLTPDQGGGDGLAWKVEVGGLDSVSYKEDVHMEEAINALILKDKVASNISYRPPENLLEIKGYNASYDIWSVACLFVRLLNNKDLFAEEGSKLDQMNIILSILGDLNHMDVGFISTNEENIYANDFRRFVLEKCSKKDISKPKVPIENLVPTFKNQLGIELLEGMLRFNPDRRFTATEALSHPYLADYVKKIPFLRKLREALEDDVKAMKVQYKTKYDYVDEVTPSNTRIIRNSLLMEKFLFNNLELSVPSD